MSDVFGLAATAKDLGGTLLVLSAIAGGLWRYVGKPARDAAAVRHARWDALADLLEAEFQVDGGASMKDAMNTTISNQQVVLERLAQIDERLCAEDRRIERIERIERVLAEREPMVRREDG